MWWCGENVYFYVGYKSIKGLTGRKISQSGWRWKGDCVFIVYKDAFCVRLAWIVACAVNSEASKMCRMETTECRKSIRAENYIPTGRLSLALYHLTRNSLIRIRHISMRSHISSRSTFPWNIFYLKNRMKKRMIQAFGQAFIDDQIRGRHCEIASNAKNLHLVRFSFAVWVA